MRTTKSAHDPVVVVYIVASLEVGVSLLIAYEMRIVRVACNNNKNLIMNSLHLIVNVKMCLQRHTIKLDTICNILLRNVMMMMTVTLAGNILILIFWFDVFFITFFETGTGYAFRVDTKPIHQWRKHCAVAMPAVFTVYVFTVVRMPDTTNKLPTLCPE